MISYEQIISNYTEELEEDTKLDIMSMSEVQQRLPANKHKWVGRLIRHKFELNKLYAQKRDAIQLLAEQIATSNPVKISEVKAKAVAERSNGIHEYDTQIHDLKITIEYLEKVERILSAMSFDIKGLIEIVRLETT
tara:strand:+ start:1707 stop:2114 length:408 start_codon:yes stop_codon:yes gene_type:complete